MRHRLPNALLTCIAVAGASGCGYRRLGDGGSDGGVESKAETSAEASMDMGIDQTGDARKGAGELCSSAFECESGVCGGRCCRADAGACLCPQPSAGNLIKNPGFDVGPENDWNRQPGGGAIAMATLDATHCPWSGSAFLNNNAIDASANISQCVPVEPSTDYNFGARFYSSTGGWLYCDLDLYPMPGCQGANTNVAQLTWVNQRWSGDNGDIDVIASIATTPTTASAGVRCYPDPTIAGYFDMIFLTPAPGTY